jgi:hypothetical protein
MCCEVITENTVTYSTRLTTRKSTETQVIGSLYTLEVYVKFISLMVHLKSLLRYLVEYIITYMYQNIEDI